LGAVQRLIDVIPSSTVAVNSTSETTPVPREKNQKT
jgi:hypothetical protein